MVKVIIAAIIGWFMLEATSSLIHDITVIISDKETRKEYEKIAKEGPKYIKTIFLMCLFADTMYIALAMITIYFLIYT